MLPAVSVVIPTYNHAAYVLDTLESVFAQTFTDYEIIVINDGSPDDTATRLQPLAESGRIRYFEQPNAGQAAARNRGLAEAHGEFVAFLDDDDLWPPDKLAWQVAVLRGDEAAGVVYGQMLEMDGSRTHPGERAPEGEVLEQFVAQGWIQSPGQVLIRHGILEQTGGYDPAIWGTDDWDLWLRLARQTRFRYEARPALIYRRHASNASKNFLRMWRNGHAVIRKNFQGQSRGASEANARQAAERFVDDFTVNDGFIYADQLTTAGRVGEAAAALFQVWRILGLRLPGRFYFRAWYRLVLRCLRGPVRTA